MPTGTFSIRTPLQGELVEFTRASGFACTHTDVLVRDLTCLLGSYREEDVPLFPEVFVLSAPTDVVALVPGTPRIRIGEAEMDDKTASAILKDCASLASRGWSIYVAKVAEKRVEFGLFRAQRHSYSTAAAETMQEAPGTSPAILIRNRGHMVVELRNSKGEAFTAAFTSALAAESPFGEHVQILAEVACSRLPPEVKAQFLPYFRRLLLDQLRFCHGTLVAVHEPPEPEGPPVELADSVWLATPLDLAGAHASAVQTKDAESLATLQALETLLEGMFNSDGVVVLGTNGTALAYRVFLKPNDDEKRAASHKGGGRQRTFDLMRSRLGDKLRAAFIRSQDGHTACERVS